MASITSSVSAGTTTYVITDQSGNTATITAPAPPGVVSLSGGVLPDGQALLTTLMLMLQTNLRPSVLVNTTASFSS